MKFILSKFEMIMICLFGILFGYIMASRSEWKWLFLCLVILTLIAIAINIIIFVTQIDDPKIENQDSFQVPDLFFFFCMMVMLQCEISLLGNVQFTWRVSMYYRFQKGTHTCASARAHTHIYNIYNKYILIIAIINYPVRCSFHL